MDISTYAFVRQPGKAWRDASIEMLTLNSSMLVDKELIGHGDGIFTIRPAWRGLIVDNARCVRFRLPDGRMAAITEVAAVSHRAYVDPSARMQSAIQQSKEV